MESEKLTLAQIFIAVAAVAFFALLLSIGNSAPQQSINLNSADLEKAVLPADGIVLPIKWNDFGKQMVDAGIIVQDKFESIYTQIGGLNKDEQQLLYGERNGNIILNTENAGFILNLLWAFGLSNKNIILEKGPMADVVYGGAGNFASTGGWTLSRGDAMGYYNQYQFVVLTEEQQKLIERVSKNIYRPCCGNSTYFPDCNHGMAMLGLLEIMASQGISEEEMYKIALRVNSYWFPDTYITIAKYFEKRGVLWKDVNPKEILGPSYSSAPGYMKILKEIEPPANSGGGGCSV